ncbi:hypothetical protein [Streptomonospora arabica]|uniref:Tail assembly chaperone n=1 Tax=Streptomonospora arabica TaxID=412417 RepID=A0ABV9SSN7_9ACTN
MAGAKQPVKAEMTKLGADKTAPEDAAEAAEAEATDRRYVLQVPTGEGETLELVLPRRWKRFKFMRRMAAGDLWGAIEVIGFAEEQMERLEEADIDEDEFEASVKALAQAVTGSSEGAEGGEQGKSSGSKG